MKRPKGFVTRQAQRLSDGEINRRRFVMSALSAGVTMPTAMSLASKAEARSPKPGGHLTLALARHDRFDEMLDFARGNALTEITSTGEVVGELAESVEPSGNHRRWYMTLRQGIDFQNGSPLTANDVLAAFSRQTHLAHVHDVRALGTHQIIMDLTESDPHFDRRLADPRLVIWSADNTTRIGTGPYVVERPREEGTTCLLRNPNYWKPGRAHFETVTLKRIHDPFARQTALMTGEVDYAEDIDPRGLALLKNSPSITVRETLGARSFSLSPANRLTAGDPTLCNALAHCIPSAAIVERFLLGHGSQNGASTPHDIEAAQRLYRQSNHAGDVRLATANKPLLRDIARLLSDEAAKAGISVHIVDQSADGADLRAEVLDHDSAQTEGAILPFSINGLAAHNTSLCHAETMPANSNVDGTRLIERWWFT